MMKWLNYFYGLCILCLILGYYQQEHHPQLKYNSLQHRLKYPLDTRVRYRIGSIDERFGLSQRQVERLAQEAIDIWHQGTGQQWFVYDKNAQLSINFIYDERQQQTIDFNKSKQQLEHIQQQREQHRTVIEPEKQRLQQQFQDIMRQQQHYQTQQKQYHHLYQYYAQHNQLHQHQQQLISMYQQLQQQEHELNLAINRFKLEETSLNFKIDRFNQLTDQFNQKMDMAKKQFPAHEFHKGQFNGYHINIYQYWSEADLRLTLAHEFGHALDLNHHNDPAGLMYPTMQEQNIEQFKLMPADLALLKQR